MARLGLARRPAVLAVAAALVLALAAPAGAVTVANPGPLAAHVSGGQLRLGNFFTQPFTAADNIAATGSIDPSGNVQLSGASLTFPVSSASFDVPTSSGPARVTFSFTLHALDAAGKLDPLTGVASLSVPSYVTITAVPDDPARQASWGTANCDVGSAAAPFVIGLGTAGGKRYDPKTGSLTLTGNQFGVPAVTTCATTNKLSTALLTLYGATPLSPAGQNALTLTGTIDPVVAAACVVPPVKGMTIAKATKALTAAGCKRGKVTLKNSSKKAGRVIGQSPTAGATKPAGTTVALTVSKGP